ncbi:ATP-dependent DNA ligase [Epithele typhae]|uniref:ATP-dependent DNA ligase n=1 Tax=Epithele typhae TaxID=378194 RepID=UPI002007CACC|nr:ATP-dependent DNA ligase [Epithele typhae]KAH9931109.1 ATP-dependent DNA ligase [Epithele typhae]
MQAAPPSLLPALYLLSNSFPRLIPPSNSAIQHVSGLSNAALKRLYNTTGDPGDVAFAAKSNVRTLLPHPPLLVTGVTKQAAVEKLLVAARGEEARFLVRTLGQNLRVGAVRTSLTNALARALVLTRRGRAPRRKKGKKAADAARDALNEAFAAAEGLLKRVYVQHPNYDHIVKALLDAGLDGLREQLPLTVGVPLLPTLGSPTRSLDEIYDRLGLLPFAAEFKYDGQRAQITRRDRGDRKRFLSRYFRASRRHDRQDLYPDVVSLVEYLFESSPGIESFIIDSEVVAIDPSTGALKTFQELSNRARKDVKLDDVKICLEKPFRERRALLHSRFPPYTPPLKGAARFDHVKSVESDSGRDAVEEFWQQAVNSSSEGLMVKLLDSGEVLEEPTLKRDKPRRKPLPATYEPDKRTSAWLKLKKDYVAGLGDSLDLVPVGAWHGNGRKAQWWSPVLLAVWDPAEEKLVAVCKCMSGLKPEVYFRPQEVWEIRGADVTVSPVSVAALGLVSETRGLSLRFPRYISSREDKRVEDASTPEFLANMFRSQQAAGKDQTGADEGDLVDVAVGESSGEEAEDAESE